MVTQKRSIKLPKPRATRSISIGTDREKNKIVIRKTTGLYIARSN